MRCHLAYMGDRSYGQGSDVLHIFSTITSIREVWYVLLVRAYMGDDCKAEPRRSLSQSAIYISGLTTPL